MTAAHADRSIHRTVVLESPADLRAPIAELLAAAQHLEIYEGIDATMAKLGQNTERHHSNLVDPAQPTVERPEPERKEPSVFHSRERLIDIQHGQTKADRASADLRQEDSVREALEHRPELLGRVNELVLGERDEPPVARPGSIVDVHGPSDFGRVVREVHQAHDDVRTPPHDLGDAVDLVGYRLVRAYLPGVEVLGLGQTEGPEQRSIVGWIVGHPDHRGLLKPLDQQPTLLVRRVSDRAPNNSHPPLTQPPSRRAEQRFGHRRVVFTLEGAEEAHPIVVELIVRVIDDGLDAAHRSAVALGEKEGRLRVTEERMAPCVEQLSALPPERRHEERIAPVKTIGDVDEPAEGPPGVGWNDLEGR